MSEALLYACGLGVAVVLLFFAATFLRAGLLHFFGKDEDFP